MHVACKVRDAVFLGTATHLEYRPQDKANGCVPAPIQEDLVVEKVM